MSRYPEDEFDIAARSRGPKGVHRQAEGAFRRLLPFLVVIVAAPLLAWGLLSLLNQDDDGAPVATPSPTAAATGQATGQATATGEPTPTPTPTPSATPEATESPEPTPSPTGEAEEAVEFATPVAVLNGAGVAGIAGRTADRLAEAGFTAVTPGNYANAQPTATTIFYNNAELAGTAQAIGAELGIDLLVELASATDSVVVVLRADFQE